MASTKEKPITGHKLASTNFGVFIRCECGWASNTWFSKGARQNVLGEWRAHQRQHVAEKVA